VTTNLLDSKLSGLNSNEIMQHQSLDIALKLVTSVCWMLFCPWFKLQKIHSGLLRSCCLLSVSLRPLLVKYREICEHFTPEGEESKKIDNSSIFVAHLQQLTVEFIILFSIIFTAVAI